MANELILIVEDDQDLRAMISAYLNSEGYATLVAGDGAEGLRLWNEHHPDLLVLDWMLPFVSGLDVARQVRAKGNTPVIMVTARGEEADIIIGLELGADDYLVKPLSLRQLSARIRAVLRRSRPEQTAGDQIAVGELQVDLAAHTVLAGGEPAPLTATEFKLLAVLVRSPNRVFSRLQLLEAAFGDYYEGYERTVDSHISRLRQKLGPHNLIQTVHGVGYKLVPPASPRP